mmetsp:Transcript_144233/g.401937  ORF Transcript_144233/g.401937 Transcript_144233/m.401937 type:complete len:253 (-) Transcript_144233:1636-2394(-)
MRVGLCLEPGPPLLHCLRPPCSGSGLRIAIALCRGRRDHHQVASAEARDARAVVHPHLPLPVRAPLQQRARCAVLCLQATERNTHALDQLDLPASLAEGHGRRKLGEARPAAERSAGKLRLLLRLHLCALPLRPALRAGNGGARHNLHTARHRAPGVVLARTRSASRLHASRRFQHRLLRPLVEEGGSIPLGRVHATGRHPQNFGRVHHTHEGLRVGVQHVLRCEGLPPHPDVPNGSPHERDRIYFWTLEEW